jgi:hypothetical protein
MNQAVSPTMSKSELRQKNIKLGLILASIAAVFFVGFITRIVLLSKPH